MINKLNDGFHIEIILHTFLEKGKIYMHPDTYSGKDIEEKELSFKELITQLNSKIIEHIK